MSKISIGEIVEFGGEKFQVVNVRREDTLEGKALYITACDPDMANHQQQEQIKTRQTVEGAGDLLKTIIEKARKGELGGGFNLGEM
jgi:hypothetical protein